VKNLSHITDPINGPAICVGWCFAVSLATTGSGRCMVKENQRRQHYKQENSLILTLTIDGADQEPIAAALQVVGV
jgi:hypothetical protein